MKRYMSYFVVLLGASVFALQATTKDEPKDQKVKKQEAAVGFNLNSSYTVDTTWQSGYQVTVTLTNNTANATTSWTASFTLPQGHKITNFWNGVYSANGQKISVTNPAWVGGGMIPAGGATTFGMIVSKPASSNPSLSGLSASANGGSPTPVPVPSSPSLNPISLSSANSYTVSWSSSANATSYTLQQDTTMGFTNPQVVAQGTMLSQNFTNVASGNYYYRVAASNSSGSSTYSNIQSVAINAPSQLSAPTLNAISNSARSSQYSVSWSTVSNAQGYNLQESTNANFSNPQTIFSGAGTSFQVTGKTAGTYYYRVSAFSGNVSSAQSNVQSTSVTQSQPSSTTFVEGYWESWNSSDSIDTIVNMKVDVIDISFVNFTTTGTHTYQVAGLDCDQATLTQLITAVHKAGKKVKVSVGGASYPLGGQLKTTQDAVGMAQAIAQFVNQNQLDGVDFDIEDFPAANLQIALLQNTRQLLGDSKLISYTPETPAMTTSPYKDVILGAYTYLNDISFMAYNYGPGYTYQQDVTAMLKAGIPASKIVIGLMPGSDDVGIKTTLANITAAANYVKQNGLGGIMFWDLNRDHENQTGLGQDAATNAAWNILQ